MPRQFQYGGSGLIDTGLVVGRDCLDVPQEQYRTPILPADPVPIYNPRQSFNITPIGLYDLTPPQLPTTPGNYGFTQFILDFATIGGWLNSSGAGLGSDGGVLTFLGTNSNGAWPVGPFGLAPGQLYLNGSPPGPWTIGVIPGYVPTGAPLYFGAVSAAGLLAAGGFPMRFANPGAGTEQLWNNGGEVAIAIPVPIPDVGSADWDDGSSMLWADGSSVEWG